MTISGYSEKDRSQIFTALFLIQEVLDKNNQRSLHAFVNDLKNNSIVSIDFTIIKKINQ